MLISDLLNRGAENGVTIHYLESLTGMDEREVRRQIEAERRNGCPILSDCRSGYFLPDNDWEKTRCVRSMRRRAMEILKTAAAIEKASENG